MTGGTDMGGRGGRSLGDRRAGERGRRRGLLGPGRLGCGLRRLHDRTGDLGDRVLPEPGGGEQLLGAVLRAGEHCARLGARPFERLLDLGAGGVRELGRLMARLLEQPVALASASWSSRVASVCAFASSSRDSFFAALMISWRCRSLSSR